MRTLEQFKQSVAALLAQEFSVTSLADLNLHQKQELYGVLTTHYYIGSGEPGLALSDYNNCRTIDDIAVALHNLQGV